MTFSDLGLYPALLDAVAGEGYTQPTPIQARAVPAVLAGRDILAAAQTGTGKTAAFALPILQRLAEGPRAAASGPRALILTPTRELAAQVSESLHTYGAGVSVSSAVIFGGVSAVPQIRALRRGVDVVVATPGRLLDHIQQGNLDLGAVETLVLDEADRMLDMGFIRDIRRIIAKLPQQRQNLLFSATFSEEIRKLAQTLLHDPVEINVAPRNAPAELVEQRVAFVNKSDKRAVLSWLIGSRNWRQVLVFTRTKHGANRLCKQLSEDGLPAAALHGNKSQAARTKALAEFKAGRTRVLVATDIAARGLDIDTLPHVINFELPHVPEDYVHRIGRTGRAGSSGEALSLVDGEEKGLLRGIQRLLRRDIPLLDAPDMDIAALRAADAQRAKHVQSAERHKADAGHAARHSEGRSKAQHDRRHPPRRRRGRSGKQRQRYGNGS